MKIWIAYRFAGADLVALKEELAKIRAAFEAEGHSVATMIEDIQRWGAAPMSKEDAIRELKRRVPAHDALVCFYFDDGVSSGRSWEAGYFDAKGKPTIMAVREDVLLREYEFALFRANGANAARDLPSVVRYHDYSYVAKALRA